MKKIYALCLCMIILSGCTQTNINSDSNHNQIDNDYLKEKLGSGQITKIKLLGDSITSGVGIPSHYIPPENPIIFDNGKEQYKEAAYTANSWANEFRNYVKDTEVDFVNAGIGGKSAKWALKNVEHLLDSNEDVIFVMYGTNDRTQGSLKDYEKNMSELLKIIDEHSNYMVVMSPPPSANDYYEFNFAPKDIDDVLKNVSEENNYTFISNYDAIYRFIEENPGIDYDDLMQTEGAHPIRLGYNVMWETIKENLHLK